jgi:redox-sensitive bicupin YhaK (pirin superfamily)
VFPVDAKRGKFQQIASHDGADGAVIIHQNVRLYDALLKTGDVVTHRFERNRHGWIHVVNGAATINGQAIGASDGAALSDETTVNIQATRDSEILLFDLR